MIKRIKIRDFKSIDNLDVELGPVTVLVGRSGTGKSNFVQAIRFLRNLLLNSENAIDYEGGWGRITPIETKAPKTSIEVSFMVPGEDLCYTYGVDFGMFKNQTFPRALPVIMAEYLKLDGKLLFSWVRGDQTEFLWLQQPNVANAPSPSGRLMFGAFPSMQNIVFAFAALSTGVGFYHFPSNVLDPRSADSQKSGLWAAIPGLWDNAGNFRETMKSIIQDFHRPATRKSLLATLRQVNPLIASIELDSLTNPTRAIVGHDLSGRIVELALDQESDGFRRFYATLLALYQTPAKLSLIFEEPENAIFPGALALLADEFKATPRENRGQVILTTHSPGLLDHFEPEQIRVVEMKDGKTVIGPLAKDQQEAVRDHLLTTGELLTVERPRIDEPATVETNS